MNKPWEFAVSEFKNVIGRAGRVYVDVEGIVLFPMFDDIARRRHNGEVLITDLGAREMESGLVLLVGTLLARMHVRVGGDFNQLIDYVEPAYLEPIDGSGSPRLPNGRRGANDGQTRWRIPPVWHKWRDCHRFADFTPFVQDGCMLARYMRWLQKYGLRLSLSPVFHRALLALDHFRWP